MIELSDIKTGTQLYLQPESVIDDDPTFELGTKFEAELGGGQFAVYAPIWQGDYYHLGQKEEVSVTFLHDGIRQVFVSRVLEFFTRGEITFLALEKTSRITEVQLREDFRLPVDADARIIFQEENGFDLVRRIQPVHLRDLSGGGVSFYTNWNPGRLTEIMMELRLESSVERINAEIRRIEASVASGYAFAVGAKFNFDTEREKERVIRHIFRMQKKMIQEHGRKTV